jgi:hypothetical protein
MQLILTSVNYFKARDKILKLDSIDGTQVATEGYTFYRPSDNTLFRYDSGTYKQLPLYIDTLFKFKNILYTWDGVSLVTSSNPKTFTLTNLNPSSTDKYVIEYKQQKGTNQGSLTITFDKNPIFYTSNNEWFKIFNDGESYVLVLPAYQSAYVDLSLLSKLNGFSNPAKLDIKYQSVLGYNINNFGLLASNDSYFNTVKRDGAIGEYYVQALTDIEVQYQFPLIRSDINKYLPNFKDTMTFQDKDLTIVLTGQSLTQGNIYCTPRFDASTRPTLMHTKDMASLLFDHIGARWSGQQYRRYDNSFFTLLGGATYVELSSLGIWDDAAKQGVTKTTTGINAGVSFVIPSEAWRFNFIYRTDSEGGTSTVTIAEGNGKVQVYHGTTWIEANGYSLSMLESAATATKGNTIFQKRLKMRCKEKGGALNSIGTTKAVTIQKGNNASRFNLVGAEWSSQEFMFTLINGARGGYQIGVTGSNNLENFQDGDIWEFKPDLVIAEATSHNWGAAFLDVDPYTFSNIAARAFFNEFGDNPDSIYVKSNQYTDCEIAFFNCPPTSGTVGRLYDANGIGVVYNVATAATNGGVPNNKFVGTSVNRMVNWAIVDKYMIDKCANTYAYIPMSEVFYAIVSKYYKNYYEAVVLGTGKNGRSLTIDGTHLNDNGAKLMFSIISQIL